MCLLKTATGCEQIQFAFMAAKWCIKIDFGATNNSKHNSVFRIVRLIELNI